MRATDVFLPRRRRYALCVGQVPAGPDMHRDPLLELLAAHRRERCLPGGETTSLDTFEAFVRGEARCFERELLIGHVTGAAWIVDAARERALLTHHRKLDRWLQLGGHCDGDPDVVAVATREAVEESGLTSLRLVSPRIFDVDVHGIPARAGEPAHFHYDARFVFEADPDEPFVVSEESKALAWVRIDALAGTGGGGEAAQDADASIRRMAAKTIDGLSAF